ncbi:MULTISPECIES: HAMP domain-containing sensor histidine kinase [unclassified Pseudomonas]|jgi:signal transduction histidine kinase|uniref:sensor histidine kinase n=1 Tax=unclassified Pseudomonas TaxID=196821 RepID=UPI000272B9CA|nr:MULTISPECIES: HAMP domain-containing sensor histidine kinase [unclassified Pseudomonas]AUO23527.1 sensor histidine kinase [Pseudomonas sp. NC02]EJF71803.1 periplasmic sensor signal transduction [Pseudomonas sp. Ag1]NVZ40458.1 HAMP domain-containing histidine kinase [Pseudomonas sp. 21615526]NWA33063.1 HAMP domain-containing histidine kinase [Pseudomonas sp. C6002]NWB44105.1 HAMP domain-containing histidine kinase [Pseudomonas sp. E6002]
MRLTLTQRLSLVFALLLLICSGTSAWLQVRSNHMHELEVVQGLSRDLAAHIARDTQLMDADGLKPDAVRNLFSQLMLVNPSVEVYLLDINGRVVGNAAPSGHLRRDQVNLEPVRRFLSGAMLPILGDDPRSVDGLKVFSAAPLRVNGQQAGYLYVVLLGEAHDVFDARDATGMALNIALWSIALVALLCLLAGLTAFAWITRPLRQLTEKVGQFDINGAPKVPQAVAPEVASQDEIAVLDHAFVQMENRLGEQWRAITHQEQERREMVANISHDLRTPLASLHGYLETLSLKDASLTPQERRRYLGIALDQSRKVGGLAQSLLELVRLEHGFVQPVIEGFSIPDLVQDIFQKFELTAEARAITLTASLPPVVPTVLADLGLIERVLTNLLDNALRHTPPNGEVEVTLAPKSGFVEVTVSDSGPGISADLREGLFLRAFTIGGARRDGGLGLRIVHRILQLHGQEIRLIDVPGRGATFTFALETRAAVR